MDETDVTLSLVIVRAPRSTLLDTDVRDGEDVVGTNDGSEIEEVKDKKYKYQLEFNELIPLQQTQL